MKGWQCWGKRVIKSCLGFGQVLGCDSEVATKSRKCIARISIIRIPRIIIIVRKVTLGVVPSDGRPSFLLLHFFPQDTPSFFWGGGCSALTERSTGVEEWRDYSRPQQITMGLVEVLMTAVMAIHIQEPHLFLQAPTAIPVETNVRLR